MSSNPSWLVSIILSTVISIISAGDSAEYEYSYEISGGDEGQCQFTGTISTHGNACEARTVTRSDFKQNGDLTWEILTKACPQLVYGGCADTEWDVSDHNMDDLLWLSCAKDADDTHYIRHTTQFWLDRIEEKTCYSCACTPYPKYIDGNYTNVYGRSCSVNHTFAGILGFDDVDCPYTGGVTSSSVEGCDDGANNTYSAGQSFFYYGYSDDNACETYCLCNDENDILCETGWKNIFDNQLLKYPFLESWHSYLSDAWDDTSRYVTPDSATCTANSIQYLSARCPNADCGNKGGADCGNKGSTWEGVEWTQGEYLDDGTFRWAMCDCVDCACVNDAPVCTTYDGGVRSAEDCSRDTLVCSYDEGGDGVMIMRVKRIAFVMTKMTFYVRQDGRTSLTINY
eukprot:945791_1